MESAKDREINIVNEEMKENGFSSEHLVMEEDDHKYFEQKDHTTQERMIEHIVSQVTL